jgi:hypothetical protein
MLYKTVVVSRNPQARNADSLGRDLDAALQQIEKDGYEPVAITPVTAAGETIGVLVTVRKNA